MLNEQYPAVGCRSHRSEVIKKQLEIKKLQKTLQKFELDKEIRKKIRYCLKSPNNDYGTGIRNGRALSPYFL